MARVCDVCDKGPVVGRLVSNANNRVKKWVYPNVHRIRYTRGGDASRVYAGPVCTKCVKSGLVTKFFNS